MYTSHSTCTMLARFITNRQVAICRLVMNLASNCDSPVSLTEITMAISVWVLSLQESSHLPPPLLSRARLDSIACETTPPCLPSFPPPPSLSSHSPSYLTFNQRAANRYKLNCHSNIAPRRQAFKTSICPSGVVPGHQPTCLQHGVNYNRGSATKSTKGKLMYWSRNGTLVISKKLCMYRWDMTKDIDVYIAKRAGTLSSLQSCAWLPN